MVRFKGLLLINSQDALSATLRQLIEFYDRFLALFYSSETNKSKARIRFFFLCGKSPHAICIVARKEQHLVYAMNYSYKKSVVQQERTLSFVSATRQGRKLDAKSILQIKPTALQKHSI